ncbi:hypothetical protein [Leadbettera azotonutricia]|uniref:Tetratricopeptide repeat domain protein n=1 Tax=Leadbettera azotonutricia (strain ATCC BAA-888 / DSM 13862 / ZAS-9) TaxID=545695 RepID=F5Y9J3_LEAAZ|nr:hypothetical protein [Leadbettera azotonutricia]AEF83248.1 tetratricopeptide repeat domain protein [Leadbettera azotonutricia ZAS-9]
MHRKQASWFLAAVLFLLAAAGSLYAGGAKDTVLSQADSLIENKEYDSAIQILTDYVKTNPEKFNDAQKRLQKIVKLREKYNTIADELLDTLVNTPEDDVRILDLTDQLIAIEPATNPSTQRFLDQVRELAAFNNNRNRLERILVQARSQLEQGNYQDALETYSTGLDIYQAEYFNSGFGPEAEAVASNGLEALAKGISDFGSLLGSFVQGAQAVQNLGTGAVSLADARRAYSTLALRMEEISQIMGSIAGVGNSYESQLAILQRENNALGDRSFLSFANRLIRGPAGQDEGMLGVLDRFWKQNIDPADATVFALAENAYNRAQTAANNRDYSGALPLLDTAEGFAGLSLDLINNWLSFYVPAGVPTQIVYDQPVVSPMVGSYLKFHSMGRAVSFMREAENIGIREEAIIRGNYQALPLWRQGTLALSSAVNQEQDNRSAFNAMIRELAVIEGAINTETETLGVYSETLAFLADDAESRTELPLLYISQAGSIVMDLESRIGDQEYQAIIRRYTISAEDLSREVTARENEFNAANIQVEGIQQNSESGEIFLSHYPTEALAALTQMGQRAAQNLATGRSLLALYAAEPQSLTGSGEVGRLYANAQDLVNRILNLQSRSGTVMAAARTQIERANALRLEGDRLFQESQTALARNNFETARERLQMATVRYHDSLAIQESPSLRTSWDTRLVNHGAEIVRVENEIVVRDVRNLVNNARTNYYAGNLEQAEDQLVRAQSRWSVTNSTEEPEVIYWLNLVRGALSLQSGRAIPQTAPLYAEMSQLLSDAKRNYDEGVRLLNSGQRAPGLARFAEARQKTRDVRLMFPMNQEARLLELRIDQQTDLSVFNAAFRQRLNDAVAGTKPAVRSTQSFADLQDLVQINPDYPGIRQLLTQAEIDMGYRPPPPDPRAIARSNELTQAAMTIINARNSTQYEVALAQLNEAIQLNPNNTQAQRGKDQVQTWMTGTGTIVLDSHSQDEYTRAVQEFTRGNNLTALAIVHQLLQNPRNQNSTLILELQRRIESVL